MPSWAFGKMYACSLQSTSGTIESTISLKSSSTSKKAVNIGFMNYQDYFKQSNNKKKYYL